MNKKKIKIKQAQSILEYLAVLAMVVLGGVVATMFFGQGVSSGLTQANQRLRGELPKTVDNTYQTEVITFDVTYSGEGGQSQE